MACPKSYRKILIVYLSFVAIFITIFPISPQASPLTKAKDIMILCADPSYSKFCSGLFLGYTDMYLEAAMMTNKSPYFCTRSRNDVSDLDITNFLVERMAKSPEMYELRAVVVVRRLLAEYFGCDPPPM